MAFQVFPNSLDALNEDTTCGLTIANDVYDHLFFRGNDNKLTPSVAKSYKQVDSTTWQFEIDTSFVFQNGDKMTMDDVVWSVLHLRDCAKTSDIGKAIADVTYSGTTLTVKAVQPDNTLVAKIIDKTLVFDKAYVTKNGQDAIIKNPIGTGPYKVTKFTPGTTVVLETWDGYPLKKPQINKIIYMGIAEDASRYIAVETGKAQYATLVSNLEVDLAAKNNKLVVLKQDSLSNQCFDFNCEKPPFNDVKVRRALAYAFDRDSFCALKGGRPPVLGLAFFGYPDLYSIPDTFPKYDLAKAKQLLAEAGYNASNPLKFELIYWTADPGLELYQSALKSIGVEMSLKQVEFSLYLTEESSGDFTMFWTSQTNKYGTALADLDRFDSALIGSRDISRYKNPKLDDLIAKMRIAPDGELKGLADQICKYLADDVPMFGGFLKPLYCVMDKNLTGVTLRGDMQQSFRFATYKA